MREMDGQNQRKRHGERKKADTTKTEEDRQTVIRGKNSKTVS